MYICMYNYVGVYWVLLIYFIDIQDWVFSEFRFEAMVKFLAKLCLLRYISTLKNTLLGFSLIGNIDWCKAYTIQVMIEIMGISYNSIYFS